jgi:serine/threonine protein kinase
VFKAIELETPTGQIWSADHSKANPSSLPLLTPGRTIGLHTLIRPLRACGMATVWLAENLDGQKVVCKFPRKLNNLHFEAIANEAEFLRRLDHPRIPRLVELTEVNATPMLVMEFIPGISLHDLIEQHGPLDLQFVVAIGAQLAGVLDYLAHEGIVHGDIKPSNIMLLGTQATLIDFGIAQAQDVHLTASDCILGTPDYSSPEQMRGECNEHTDVRCLAATLYAALEGHAPYHGSTPGHTAWMVAKEPHKDWTNPLDPVSLCLDQCFCMEPDDRPGAADLEGQLLELAFAA